MIQKEIEKAGIATVSLTHYPDLTSLVHAPRALHIKFPLGRTFGQPGREDLQKKITEDMLKAITEEKAESVRTLSYRWKRD
ncbi:hypothetical protein [Alkalicoccus halolimnae]|uniref:Uncharacterized protein n=1 Tax=Alkalicoccus halolimnae TaxID=1667239 RepID=A0A5C7F5H4_9BACI|nr:hypothetical protein [Alkalicoccus halolimnae]TXF85882.1 hypothetical protein FTX54_07330 [Alkalicoccus halolimnae]